MAKTHDQEMVSIYPFNDDEVDKMMTKKPKATYTWTEVALSKQEKIGDYNIQRYQTTRNRGVLKRGNR